VYGNRNKIITEQKKLLQFSKLKPNRIVRIKKIVHFYFIELQDEWINVIKNEADVVLKWMTNAHFCWMSEFLLDSWGAGDHLVVF